MTLSCLKTGCHAYVEQYDQWVYGDAFSSEAGSCRGLLIIRVAEVSIGKPVSGHAVRHIDVCDVAQWWDQHREKQGTASTLVCEGLWRWHGYDGKPIAAEGE